MSRLDFSAPFLFTKRGHEAASAATAARELQKKARAATAIAATDSEAKTATEETGQAEAQGAENQEPTEVFDISTPRSSEAAEEESSKDAAPCEEANQALTQKAPVTPPAASAQCPRPPASQPPNRHGKDMETVK